MEKSLKEDTEKERLQKLEKQEAEVVNKRKKLLNSYLEGTVEKEIYESMDIDLERKLTDLRAKIDMLTGQVETETDLKKRISEFKELLSENRVLEEFDRGVFESIVEKVIIGGYDEEGNKDPYKVTFIYKTGFRNGVDNSKKKYGKLCSDRTSEVDNLCSNDSTDARGGRGLKCIIQLSIMMIIFCYFVRVGC